MKVNPRGQKKTKKTDSWFFNLLNPPFSKTWQELRSQAYYLVPSRTMGCLHNRPPQLGAADAEVKVPFVKNIELKRSSFKAWSRSVYCHTWNAYCQGLLPCLFLPFWSIHLQFFQNLSRFLLCWLWLTHGCCIGPQNKTGPVCSLNKAV